MLEVRVVGVALDATEQHVILLGDASLDDEAAPLLPIWVGAAEASSILMGAGQIAAPRPMTHDLVLNILESMDATVSRAEITSVDEGTFFAVLHMESPVREHIVDARPSDAIAVAIRSNAPIFVAQEVFDEASVSEILDLSPDKKPEPAPDLRDFKKFQEFIESVDPEDFIDPDSSSDSKE